MLDVEMAPGPNRHDHMLCSCDCVSLSHAGCAFAAASVFKPCHIAPVLAMASVWQWAASAGWVIWMMSINGCLRRLEDKAACVASCVVALPG